MLNFSTKEQHLDDKRALSTKMDMCWGGGCGGDTCPAPQTIPSQHNFVDPKRFDTSFENETIDAILVTVKCVLYTQVYP